VFETLAVPFPATIQDLGRVGYRHFGVPVSGALDRVSLKLANALVGNRPDAAALEMRFVGPKLRALTTVRVALAHAEATIERNDGSRVRLPPWQTATLAAGECLDIHRVHGGVGYLAVTGGFATPLVLGSRSTDLRAGWGCALREGTTLPVGDGECAGPERRLSPPDFPAGPIRVIPGPQAERFTAAAWETFLSDAYTVTEQADRMGLRLAGPPLTHQGGADIVSEGVAPGSIQVPADGQPIVLLADAQTVGGYAKIATVISADLPRLGRMLPGASLRFTVVDLVAAQAALVEEQAWFTRALASIRPATEEDAAIDQAALYEANLIDGVVYGE